MFEVLLNLSFTTKLFLAPWCMLELHGIKGEEDSKVRGNEECEVSEPAERPTLSSWLPVATCFPKATVVCTRKNKSGS